MPQLPLTIGQVARHFGCPPWAVRRLFERRILPEPPRVGAYRVVAPEQLPEIGTALKQAGYIAGEGDAHAAQ
jgi:hypothetical protein